MHITLVKLRSMYISYYVVESALSFPALISEVSGAAVDVVVVEDAIIRSICRCTTMRKHPFPLTCFVNLRR